MPTLKKNDKKPTKSSNEDRVAAMIASGKWKKGPNGELLRVSEDSNKEAYDSGAPQVELGGFPAYAPYNRTTDGSDILLFSNEFIKTQLEAKGYSVVIVDLN